MKKKLKITKPCHENWEEMKTIEKGKHCAVCSKSVIDFTQHSRTEIINFLEVTEGQTCGRFKPEQVDIYGKEKAANNKRILPFYKVAAASILTLFGSGVSNLTAQDGEFFMLGDVAVQEQEAVITNGEKVLLQGVISSQHSGPISKAKVSIYSGTKLINSVITKEDGSYLITANKGTLRNKKYSIKVFASGFGPKIFDELEVSKSEITMNITMEYEMMIMGKMIIEPIEEKKPKKRIEKITLPEKEASIELDSETRTPQIDSEIDVTVYPNPSRSQVFVRTNKEADYTYSVMNMNGKLIFSGTKKGETFELNFAGKPNGIYLISIYNNGVLLETKRVVIEH